MDGDNPSVEDRSMRSARERSFVMDRDRKAIHDAALEEAAWTAEHLADGTEEIWHAQRVLWGDKIAAAIRALKEAE